MKRVFAFVLTLIFVVGMLTACGSKTEKMPSSEEEYKKYTVQMHIDFIGNLLFSKYDVDILLDGVTQYTLEHGTNADYTFSLKEGTYTFTFVKAGSSSVKGETTIDVKSDVDASYKIYCYNDKVSVETEYLDAKNILGDNEAKIMYSETNFIGVNYKDVVAQLKELGFTNIKEISVYDIIFDITEPGSTKDVSIGGSHDYKRGDVFIKDTEIIVTYSMRDDDLANKPTTTEPGDPTPSTQSTPNVSSINVNFPEENAYRAAVVAFTNCFADDVFTADGNDYDTTKFHSYSDVSGFFMHVDSRGNWTGKDENTWHVEHLKLRVNEYNSIVDASLDVSFDGTNYNVYNLAGKAPSYDDNDSKFSSMTDLESVSVLFLIVPSSLIKDDRAGAVPNEQSQKSTDEASSNTTERYPSGLSSWDGDHTGLKKLIKANMNDASSYKHIDTQFQYIDGAKIQEEINEMLANAGLSDRISIGDFFIVIKFSGKNAFNATVKNTAFGIECKDGSVKLLAIE